MPTKPARLRDLPSSPNSARSSADHAQPIETTKRTRLHEPVARLVEHARPDQPCGREIDPRWVVGQDVLDHLVGVIAQLGAAGGVVVTTCGYTAGAVAVAADANIALLRLRHYDPENPEPFVKRIALTINWISSRPVEINVQAELPEDATGPAEMSTGTNLLHPDGTLAETLLDLFKANSSPIDAEPGRYPHEVRFDGSRLFPVPDSEPAPLAAVTWTEVVAHHVETNVTEFDGEPLLILEQYNDQGEIDSGRMVIDLELFAWDIDSEGRGTERGPLAGERKPREQTWRVD